MSGPKVAISGATGNLGTPILKALLAANYPVVVLSRKGSDSRSKLPPSSNITVVEVDYTSVAELTAALQGVEVVVSAVTTAATGGQNALIDASVAAGVKRFIPSEFGSNTTNEKTVQLPVIASKVATQKYLEQVAAKNPGFSYSLVLNGPFLDWGLAVGFIINPSAHTATVYNGGDVAFSATLLDDIAGAVVGIVKNQDATANRAVFVHSAVVTQNQLIGYAKEIDGKEWSITPASTEEIRLANLKKLQEGATDVVPLLLGLLTSALFGDGYGQNFSAWLDNDLLGIKTLDEAGVKDLVKAYL